MKNAFAVATVVGRMPPVSSHLGDRAVIRADGRMEGFVGGACARDIVRRQALEALASGEPRLVRIRPDAHDIVRDRDSVTVPMSCTSEGGVDVYIEPYVPKRTLFLAGFSPVADALAQMAPLLDHDVVRFVAEPELADTNAGAGMHVLALGSLETYLDGVEAEQLKRSAAIAASQGHYDEPALAAFLKHDIGFVGLLASTKRAAHVGEYLSREGIPRDRLSEIRNPVGLDIGARKPAEVAVSIFAQIVAERAAEESHSQPVVEPYTATAVDPICGMNVDVTSAIHRLEREGHIYYFCSGHCREAFAGAVAS